MFSKSLIVMAGFAMLSIIGTALSARAQTSTVTGQGPSFSLPEQRPRIQVYPQRLLYRRCVDWYEIQHRPSGTVLYPQIHCWWVRG